MLRITVGDLVFTGEFVKEAPLTVEAFTRVLPFEQRLIQARWSGEAAWIPLGNYKLGVGFENATCYPDAGEILFYPGGYSETEILFPYGHSSFASTLGQLAGNHFITITGGRDQLKEVGRRVVWEGAQTIRFELVEPEVEATTA